MMSLLIVLTEIAHLLHTYSNKILKSDEKQSVTYNKLIQGIKDRPQIIEGFASTGKLNIKGLVAEANHELVSASESLCNNFLHLSS